MLSIVTLFTITTMGLERVIALHFPYKYSNWVTRKNVFCTIAVDWLVPAIIIAIPYGMMDPAIKECNFGRFITFGSMIIFSMTYFLFMLLGVLCQLVMFMVARHHINKILPTLVGDERKTAALKMNSKATLTTLCVAVPFIICASPKILTYLYLAYNPQERLKLYSVTMLAVTFYINVTNSFLNPFIYCWRMPEIRHSIRKLFCPNSGGKEGSITQSTSRG
ncbi:adrenocorticotropic hormone receptor-like [Littorina saxatilis]